MYEVKGPNGPVGTFKRFALALQCARVGAVMGYTVSVYGPKGFILALRPVK